MRRAAPCLAVLAAALGLAAAVRAELPMPVFPECGEPDRPDLCPNDLGLTWNFLSYVPAEWKPHVREAEWELGSGMHADRAWRRTTGDWDAVIAVTDSGIYWGESNTRRKIRLNVAELPPPQREDGGTAEGELPDPYDLDGNGLVNVEDYALDPRVDPASGSDTDAWQVLDPGDLIATFSDGVDDDGNGYVDDIAGWDFMWDDNDPFDDTEFGHGYWEAREAASEGNDGGHVSPCPNCSILPLRVSDSFIADGNRFAIATVYAVDQGAQVVNCALGTLTHSTFARAAVDYAWERGALVMGSAADETSYHLNWPSGSQHTLYVNDIRYDDADVEDATSFLQFANSTNYGPRVDVAAPATGASSRATAVAAGVTGLVFSASLAGSPHEGIDPLVPPLSANETYQILTSTTHDIDIPESRGEGADPDKYPSKPGWDRYFGHGRIHAARAVDAVLDRQIPPEADITSPEWFAYLDPDATPELVVSGYAAARRSASYSWVLEWAPGDEPDDAEFVEIARADGLTEATQGALATFRLADIPASAFDAAAQIPAITKDHDNVTRADRAFLALITLRLRVTDAEGRSGAMRRAIHVRRDPDSLPGFPMDLGASAEASPKLADLDGDRVYEVVQVTTDGEVHALRGDGTPLEGWPVRVEPFVAVDPDRPANHRAAPAFASGSLDADVREAIIATPAVGDVDGDGSPDVVVATLGGRIWAFSAQGVPLQGFPARIDPAHFDEPTGPENVLDTGFFAAPALGDLDGDGVLDIAAGGLDGWLYAFDGQARTLPGFPVQLAFDPEGQVGQRNRITSSPAVADLDGDGRLDVIVGTNQAINTSYAPVFAVHGDGNEHPGGPFLEGWPAILAAVYAEALPYVGEGVPSAPALADLDGDGSLEVFASAVTDPGHVRSADGSLFLDLGFLADEWGRGSNTRETAAVMMVHSGSFGDLDGDGRPELVDGVLGIGWITGGAADWRREEFDHLLGAWQMDDGRMLDAFPRQVEDFQFFMNPAIADITGDGAPEAISGTGGYLVNAFDKDGASPEGWPKMTGQWIAGSPAVGDVDGDGYHDVVVSTRGGWLFAWTTRGRADVPPEWGSFHHDARNTGNYEEPIEAQPGPTDEQQPPAEEEQDPPGGCGCGAARGGAPSGSAVVLALGAWAARRRRSPATPRGPEGSEQR
ncbi:FG-GAP-like repeat-containing protein [Myxococcota bacterium]|nr:FG-GAP-like repeat-containing protein [Myxococcota bacterium]